MREHDGNKSKEVTISEFGVGNNNMTAVYSKKLHQNKITYLSLDC